MCADQKRPGIIVPMMTTTLPYWESWSLGVWESGTSGTGDDGMPWIGNATTLARTHRESRIINRES